MDKDKPAGRHTWSQLRGARFWWITGVTMVLFVLYATLSPANDVPDLEVINDKIEHGLAFFGMTFWFGGLMSQRRFWLLGAAMSGFGAAIEVAQGTMGFGRDMDWHDWLADTIGVVAAVLLLHLVVRLTGGSWMRLAERLLGRQRPSGDG